MGRERLGPRCRDRSPTRRGSKEVGCVSAEIVTAIDATIDQDREQDLLDGYRPLMEAPKPDGLLHSELLRGQGGLWRIQTTWRDRDALMAVRNSGRPPAALELLDRMHAEHSHGVFTVEASYYP
jgi:hypothetical protein